MEDKSDVAEQLESSTGVTLEYRAQGFRGT
jgi:hypothetical protein